MNQVDEGFPILTKPVYLKETAVLLKWMQSLSFDELQSLWRCNDKLAALNYDRIRHMDLNRNLSPAVLSYEGLQYQYMAPAVFSDKGAEYIADHLRILSGFYGILSPFDGVTPYRLEMQAKAAVAGTKNLYEFWGDKIYRAVAGDIIVNLASEEYAKCVKKYLTAEDRMLTCVFGEITEGKVRQKGTLAKMARGSMVRFMAENEIDKKEDLKEFDGINYRFAAELSTKSTYVFEILSGKKK